MEIDQPGSVLQWSSTAQIRHKNVNSINNKASLAQFSSVRQSESRLRPGPAYVALKLPHINYTHAEIIAFQFANSARLLSAKMKIGIFVQKQLPRALKQGGAVQRYGKASTFAQFAREQSQIAKTVRAQKLFDN